MPKILTALVGGLGFATLQSWSPDQITEIKNKNIDLLYIDTHSNQFNQISDAVIKLSANSHGAGGDFDSGSAKFQNIKKQVTDLISQYDLVLIFGGFGGGTGSSFAVELVNICNQLNKFKIVVGNSLKFEEFYQEKPKFNFELVTDIIETQAPYLIIDSSKIEDYLCKFGLMKHEYEKYFSNISYSLINSFYLLLNLGIDYADLRSILPIGKIHFGISQKNEVKKVVKDLLNDDFLVGNSARLTSYTLLYPRVEQLKFNQILNGIESNLRTTSSKHRETDTLTYILIGSLTPQQIVTDNLQTVTDTLMSVDYNQQKRENQLNLMSVLTPQQTATDSKTDTLPTVNRQQFLELIWDDEGLDNLSLREAEKHINSKIQELELRYQVQLEKTISKGAIEVYKNNRK